MKQTFDIQSLQNPCKIVKICEKSTWFVYRIEILCYNPRDESSAVGARNAFHMVSGFAVCLGCCRLLIKKEGEQNMKRKVLVKVLALLMAFSMTLGCGASAFAETSVASFITEATMPTSLTQLMTASNVLVESITVSAKTTMKAGESDYPTVTVLPTTATNKTVTWSSNNTSVATVTSAGVVYARSAGQALITATANDGSGKFAYYVLTVTPAYDDETRVSKVSITNKNSSMKIGTTYNLAWSVEPSTATNKTLTFSSSNTAVATITDKGVITAVGAGTTTIVAAANDNTSIVDSYELTVDALIPVTQINVTGKASMAVGETATFTATVLPADASYQGVVWSSSNTNVATVDQKGNVTVVASGTVVITATSVADTNVYGSFVVGIENVPITWISLTGKTGMVYKETAYIGYTITPSNASNKKLLWTSSNTSVATVDQNGKVTASKKTAGTTIITAAAQDGSGVKATMTLSVSKTVINVKSVTVTGRSLIGVGETIQAAATVAPSNAHNQVLYWVSDNPTVANVDQTGKVTAYAAGTAMISAIATDGTLVRGGYVVTVKDNYVKVTEVRASGKTELYPKAVSYSAYEIYPVNADDKTVSWMSSNANVASVNEYGVVTAHSVGTTVITAIANDGSGKYGSYTVTVSNNQVLVTKVNVTGKPAMGIGEVQYLAYEIWPANATEKSVTWTSSNANVATVNQYGVVTGKTYGQAVITATAIDGSKQSASFIVNVGTSKTLVNRLEIYGKGALTVGETEYLAYAAWPVNADDKSVMYTSSNAKVASVSEYGVVKAVAAGTASITAIARDGSGVTASYDVVVSNAATVPVTYVGVSGRASMMVGEVQYLAYEILPVNATNKTVTYTSSNPAVATVNQYGMVTAVGVGSANVTATANDGSGKQASITVTVNPVAGQVTKIVLYGKGSLGIGSVEYLSYEVWPADAVNKGITFSTSNKKVATVNEYGVVTGVGKGTATITATAKDGSGVKGTYTVNVSTNTQKVTKIALYGKGTLNVGSIENLSYEVWPADAANKGITFATSNSTVATVNEYGVVTAKAAGTAIITATAKDGSGIKGTYTVTVAAIPVTYVGVSGKTNLVVGEVNYASYEILPANASNKGVTYTSSNPGVASVTSNGIVTAVGVGSATITATANDGSGKSASYTVYVSIN